MTTSLESNRSVAPPKPKMEVENQIDEKDENSSDEKSGTLSPSKQISQFSLSQDSEKSDKKDSVS
jgi:hypothetical protein